MYYFRDQSNKMPKTSSIIKLAAIKNQELARIAAAEAGEDGDLKLPDPAAAPAAKPASSPKKGGKKAKR